MANLQNPLPKTKTQVSIAVISRDSTLKTRWNPGHPAPNSRLRLDSYLILQARANIPATMLAMTLTSLASLLHTMALCLYLDFASTSDRELTGPPRLATITWLHSSSPARHAVDFQ